MSHPALPLQKAVRDALNNLVPGVKVYDAVPDNAPFPFIHIGDDHITGNSSHGQWFDCTVNVHVYVRDPLKPGKVRLKEIVAAIHDALNVQLAVAGFDCMTSSPFVDVTFLTQSDNKTEHAIIEFEYLLQPV